MKLREQPAKANGSWASSEAARRSMVGNRSRDTRPEKRLRSYLHGLGLRYRVGLRLEAGGLRVRPDIVFTRARVVVFVDGCFWHCCPTHHRKPRKNTGYWLPKLAANVARDRAVDTALRDAGWTVVRVWEHEPPDAASERVVAALAATTAR